MLHLVRIQIKFYSLDATEPLVVTSSQKGRRVEVKKVSVVLIIIFQSVIDINSFQIV